MKSEFPYLKEFESVEDLKKELKKYITYYNTKLIKAKLKGMSPYNIGLMPNPLPNERAGVEPTVSESYYIKACGDIGYF